MTDTKLRCRHAVAVSVAALAWSLPPSTHGDQALPRREWHFQVLLDGKPIGQHDFVVSGSDEAMQVTSRAQFVVTVLHLPVYRYRHEDDERWHGECLVQMDASTNDNGRESHVRGRIVSDTFEVSGPHGNSTLQGCVRSFAYWDRRILDEHQLLNAQTGEYVPVRITRVPEPGPTEHYRLDSSQLHIELWYSATGQWCALKSKTSDGKELRYELRP